MIINIYNFCAANSCYLSSNTCDELKCCIGVKLCCHFLAVSGLGFGFMSGAFSVVNILADSVGPGTVGIHGDSQHYFLSSGSIAHSNVQSAAVCYLKS